jgi:hypothetical protein
VLVATLGDLQFFGEAAIAGESEEERLRGATVTVASASVQLLKLHRAAFDRLTSAEEGGRALRDVASSMAQVRSRRLTETRSTLSRRRSGGELSEALTRVAVLAGPGGAAPRRPRDDHT